MTKKEERKAEGKVKALGNGVNKYRKREQNEGM
jgi:hypothetical protein